MRKEEIIQILSKINFHSVDSITDDEADKMEKFLKHLAEKNSFKTDKQDFYDIIERFYQQMVFVHRTIDALDTIEELNDSQKEKMMQSENFFYITRKSLAYMCIIILGSILKQSYQKNEITIYAIIDKCLKQKDWFDDVNIDELCSSFKNKLKLQEETIKKLLSRRDKSLAHFECDYFFLNKNAMERFPIPKSELRNVANLLYQFAEKLRDSINPNPFKEKYPPHTDDLKRLFGLKTKDDLWLEETD